MNVYDFDGTIYRGDSSVDFYKYCLMRFPWLILLLPYQLLMIVAYKTGFCSKEKEKSAYFSFLKFIPDFHFYVEKFWEQNKNRIASWYLHQQKDDDLIISASPDFLLRPVCKKIGVNHLIASIVNPNTGKLESNNCFGQEKVIRFQTTFPHASINKFYSDSKSDKPLAYMAQTAYFVKNGSHISKWI